MLQLKKGQKVVVWAPHFAERIKDTIEANISSAKKGSEKWIYYSWNAKFVGRAYQKANEIKLQEKDLIEIKEAAVENYYDQKKDKLYVTVIVFDFEKITKEE